MHTQFPFRSVPPSRVKAGCITLIFVICMFFIIGCFTWTYSINTWLLYFEKDQSIKWYMGGLIGIIPAFGQLSIPVAIITWILMLFLM